MKHHYFNPQQAMLSIIGAALLLLMIYQTGKAERHNKIDEVSVTVTGSNTLAVQVRTDDGRPVKFELFNTSGLLIHAQSIFHRKVTPVKGIPSGAYKYRFTSSDNDIHSGKISL